MQDVIAADTTLGYCTNVHTGTTLDEIRANLERYAVAVKQRVSPDAPMGVGLWFSADAAREAITTDAGPALRDWLQERGLLPYTLNGFPQGDFHQPVVKDAVYQPHWADPRRDAYTRDLITLLAQLLPDGAEGSISTLPLGWPAHVGGSLERDPDFAPAAAKHLTGLVHHLARTELDTGHLIHLDLEPEPGCLLQTSRDVVDFFDQHLLGTADDLSVRSYLRVCHDVCHSAVMFEKQEEAVRTYRDAGLSIGKVQLSSALVVDFGALAPADAAAARTQLAAFAEPRYLHQTRVRRADGTVTPYTDLPDALAGCPDNEGEWRVHFHVPLHRETIGALGTTRSDVSALLAALRPGDEVSHFEVETYAWGVLPDGSGTGDADDALAAGIAAELKWVRDGANP